MQCPVCRHENNPAQAKYAVTAHERTGIGAFFSLSVTRLGEAYLLANEVETARACAARPDARSRAR